MRGEGADEGLRTGDANRERVLVLLIVDSLLIHVAPALNWFNESHALEVGLQGTSEKTL